MKLRTIFLTLFVLCLSSGILGCGGSSDDVKDLVDSTDVERRPIDTTRMGINAFANESFAGSPCSQFAEIRNSIRLRFVRVLFSWTDSVQPTPDAAPNFSFYDDILNCIPSGVDALVILTNVPSWMSDPANWDDGNPRLTFVRRWVAPVVTRYAGHGRIVGYQLWNEPDSAAFPENTVVGTLNNPINFVELVALGANAIRDIDPSKLVVNGATRSIAQDYPDNLNYNIGMRDAGIEAVVDRYAIHYYGTNFERLVIDVDDFLNQISKPIWVTESGKQGVTTQLAYVERVWPYLRERIPGIDRIYYYRFAESTSADVSFGLKTPDPAGPVSDLYLFLQDRP